MEGDTYSELRYQLHCCLHRDQSSCPGWKDAKSMVALLRQSNYSVDDCVSTYHSINDDGERKN